jgi:hypothetical protein
MSHLPVNHPLRPLYRTLAALCAIFVLVFGVAGLITGRGGDTFGHDGTTSALGLGTNLGFSVISLIAGAILLLGVFLGRNIDRFVNLWGGIGFMVVGIAMLAVLGTDINVLNFTMPTVIVSFVIGMVLYSAGLYGRTGSASLAQAEEAVRHGAH